MAGNRPGAFCWWRAKSRRRFCLPTVAVSANINAPSRSCWHSLPDAYEDWTFRQAESRLAEPRDCEKLCIALWADDTTLSLFAALDEDPVARGWEKRCAACAAARPGAGFLCIDGTGVSPHAVRTYFLRRRSNKMAEKSASALWQWLIVVDGKHSLLAQAARKDPGSTAGLARVRGCGGTTAPLCLCWPRAEFDSEPIPPIRQRWRRKVLFLQTPSGCSARNVARADVSQFSAETVRTTGEGRNRLLGGKTQAVGTRSGSRLVRQVRQASFSETADGG